MDTCVNITTPAKPESEIQLRTVAQRKKQNATNTCDTGVRNPFAKYRPTQKTTNNEQHLRSQAPEFKRELTHNTKSKIQRTMNSVLPQTVRTSRRGSSHVEKLHVSEPNQTVKAAPSYQTFRNYTAMALALPIVHGTQGCEPEGQGGWCRGGLS